MSVCTFLAANCVLKEKLHPEYDSFIEIDTVKGTIYDGDRDDDYALLKFEDISSYSELSQGVIIEWNYCTPGRARDIIGYIKNVLRECDLVELWNVWLMDYYEYDERPRYRKKEISAEELKPEDIMDISNANVWENSTVRPTYYCLKIRK